MRCLRATPVCAGHATASTLSDQAAFAMAKQEHRNSIRRYAIRFPILRVLNSVIFSI